MSNDDPFNEIGTEYDLEADRADRTLKEEVATEEQFLRDLREILRMDSGAGLRVFRRYIDISGLFGGVFVKDSRIYYRAGQIEFGQQMMRDITLADPRSSVRLQLVGWAKPPKTRRD